MKFLNHRLSHALVNRELSTLHSLIFTANFILESVVALLTLIVLEVIPGLDKVTFISIITAISGMNNINRSCE